MKQNAQYYADKAEEYLALAAKIEPTMQTAKNAERAGLIAEAQVYATLAVAAAQDRGRT